MSKIETIIERVLLTEEEKLWEKLEKWLNDTVKKSIPGLAVGDYGKLVLKGVKDPASNKQIEIMYVSTIGRPAIVFLVPKLNIGTTGGYAEDVHVEVDVENLSDQGYSSEIEMKVKAHFARWSKFFSKYESLYKEKDSLKSAIKK